MLAEPRANIKECEMINEYLHLARELGKKYVEHEGDDDANCNWCTWNSLDTKQYDAEVPVMLELWELRSPLSLPLLQVPLWPGVLASDRALSMG